MERKRNIQPDAERRRAEAAARRAEAEPRYSATSVFPSEIERRVGARARSANLQSAETVRLIDLSANGCCIGFTAKTDYRPGQFIRLGFPGEGEAVSAIVRWTEGLRVGAEFTRSLPSHRIDAILNEDRNPLVGLL